METILVVVLVLYQKKLKDTPNYLMFKDLLKKNNCFKLFIYDNSLEKQEDELMNLGNVIYIHDKTNPGIAVAYNYAKQYLKEIDANWLLLLDHDTRLPEDYISKIFSLKESDEVAAYVPIVRVGDKQISPVYSSSYIGSKSQHPTLGLTAVPIMAINSGTILTAKTLSDIQLFSLDFPLDFLDHWLFWKLAQDGKKIMIMDETLEHDLSVLDYSTMTNQRYDSILSSETIFYSKYDKKNLEAYKRNLILRCLKQFFFVKNRQIWRRTYSELQVTKKGN